MSKAGQTEQKEIGRIKLSDTQELVAFVLDNKKRHFSIVDRNMKDKKEGPLYKLAEKRCNFWGSLIVFLVVVLALKAINCLAWWRWRVYPLWWLLPTVILGIGLLVQFLDAYLAWGRPERVEKVYSKLKKKSQESM